MFIILKQSQFFKIGFIFYKKMNNIEIVLSQNDICRLCMSLGKDLISIHSNLHFSNREESISVILFKCTSLQVDKNNLYPQNICKMCVDRLTNAYLFREMCLQTQNKIAHLFDNFSSYCIKIGQEIEFNGESAVKTVEDYSNNSEGCCEIKRNDNGEGGNIKKSEDKLKTETKLKSNLCPICGKSFRQSQELTVHIRRHNGEKPFKCDKCTSSFVSSSRLTAHKRVHTGERPFQCKICNSAFGHSSVLAQHLRKHFPAKQFRCNVCGKHFAALSYLNIHKRSHSGEKPLQCGWCSRSFADPNNLKRHVLTHTNERRFLCVVCGKAFRRNQHLKSHMTNVHDNS